MKVMVFYDVLVCGSHICAPMDVLVIYALKFTLNVSDDVSDDFNPITYYGAHSGSLSSTRSFAKVAADKARSIVLLANKDDP